MLILIFFVSSVVFVFAKNEFYMGHRVYNVRFDIEDQQDMFYTLKSDLIDYWRKPSLKHNVTGQVMVPPSHIQWFEEKLHELYIKKDIYIDDVYSYLTAKEPSQKSSRNEEDIDLPVFNFNGYFRYYEILDYMRSLESEYSNSNEIKVAYVEAGVTDEGRPLVYLEISSVADADTKVPIAVVEAGIIPREWITVPSALNIVKELTSETQLLRGLKWIVIPVVNPDGYEYTHTNLRLWSKNRSTRSNLGFICPGANINRNFDMAWMFSDSSSSPCSHLYGGEEAFSEPEARMIRTIIEEYGRRMRMYVSLQNGGGYVAYPWHYERAASGMFRQHRLLGMEIVNILGNQHALDIGFLAAGDRVSGTSADYAMDHDVMYTFSINIDGQGDDGVMIPEDEIVPTVDRVWRAVSLIANEVLAL